MEPTIRKYHPSDKEDCILAFRSNVPRFFTEEEVGEFIRFLERMETTPEDEAHPFTHFYVVVENGKIIGAGGFGDKNNRNIISLAWGLIHSDHHKKDYGKKLLLFRLEQIKKIYPGKPLIVDTTQHAYSFFEKYGFVTNKITDDYYTEGMHRYDMCFHS